MHELPTEFGLVSKADMDAVLKFLPIFESEGFKLGTWIGDEPLEEGGSLIPDFDLSTEGHEFLQTLYQDGWIVNFDYSAWNDEACRYMSSPDALENADIETLQKLLTGHVRWDRFCTGHLESVFESGHLIAILKRLKVIWSSME